jgi:hypothetical protein
MCRLLLLLLPPLLLVSGGEVDNPVRTDLFVNGAKYSITYPCYRFGGVCLVAQWFLWPTEPRTDSRRC